LNNHDRIDIEHCCGLGCTQTSGELFRSGNEEASLGDCIFWSVIQIVHDFDELDRLRFHDKATQVDAENIDMEEEKLRLMFEVTRQRLL
jgi:hypothetical protein